MEFTEKLFANFLDKLIVFNKYSQSAIYEASYKIKACEENENGKWDKIKTAVEQKINDYITETDLIISDFQKQADAVLLQDIEEKSVIFARLQKCKEQFALVTSAEKSITDKFSLSANISGTAVATDISIEDILQGKIDFIAKAYEVNAALDCSKKKNYDKVCSSFFELCHAVKGILNQEITALRNTVIQNREVLYADYNNISESCHDKMADNWISINKGFDEITRRFASKRNSIQQETANVYSSSGETLKKTLKKLVDEFCRQFPSQELADEYARLCALEPSYENYECFTEMPRNVRIGSLEYDISSFKFSEYTKSFLNRYYFFMFRGNKLSIPYCVSFGSEFNYMFRFKGGEGRSIVVKNACDLGLRLFMMLPPGKLNFTFIDPITLGESFAMFTRLVDANDRTSEIINGKIWSEPSDIEEKLRIMTNHIANVTQRCLQGKYDSIYEYNKEAEQNAEAYQIIMLMDFPTGLTDQSLKLLEQIATSGTKCGVFTILYQNESQLKKISERSYPLVSNIEKNFQVFDYSESCNEIIYFDDKIKGKTLCWKCPAFTNQEHLDSIINKLKLGIKSADRIVVNFSKIIPSKDDWFKGDCSKELTIPIGVHGANNIQNLLFGIGGSHHALVVGQIGSGKSSLLHTIIMSAIIKYPANQLQIFLVDFKRGVEFKIYANYSLENFKVIAIESEREFGCSVLEYLDKEQSRRADKFKRLNVDNVEDYRNKSGEVLPRILLIIDEFHVLFSKDISDINVNKSAVYLEQIIRQGRAFGIHAILASQTMSDIGGINYGVWGQVGVRIALKCPKTDAKFVLGSDNDGADLLSADNPGQAIYNSDCGKITANTVFRVAYIDQNEQDEYLQYISENEPKFNYSATRVMLSNVEDNIYNPLQMFARGENYKFEDNSVIIGEPLKLINNMKMVFKQKQGSNMLVIGNDEQKARTLFTFAALSLSLHTLTKHSYHSPDVPTVYLFDYAPLEIFEEKDDTLLILSKRLPEFIKYVPFDESEEAMRELYQIFERREKGTEQKEEFYMLVYGLQRARNLRSSDIYKENVKFDEFDEFEENSFRKYLTLKPYDMFINLLQRGASLGINAIVWEDNFKLFMNSYSDMLPNFDMRIAFTMPDDDSINFIEEPDGSKIGEDGAIYNYNGNQKFRPYKKPDAEWIEAICTRITKFR